MLFSHFPYKLVFIICLFSSCQPNPLIGVEVDTNVKGMSCYFNGNETNNSQRTLPSRYTIVVFSGANDCGTCYLKQIHNWDNVADALGRDNINYLFIVNSAEDDSEYISYVLKESFFSFPVYIDERQLFINNNPYILDIDGPTCLLLDDYSTVLSVGHPESSRKDLRKFRHIIYHKK